MTIAWHFNGATGFDAVVIKLLFWSRRLQARYVARALMRRCSAHPNGKPSHAGPCRCGPWHSLDPANAEVYLSIRGVGYRLLNRRGRLALRGLPGILR